jgi:N-acetylglucosaminyldiphosphoundecaprenol N-acetyl-beta-D-mannosaminyltransferase
MSTAPHANVTILGVEVARYTYASLLDQLAAWITDDAPLQQICTVNPEFFVIARDNLEFYTVLQQATCVADGIGIVLAARLVGGRFPARVTGSDALDHIAAYAATNGWRLFLLGAAVGIAEKTAAILTERYPDLQIAGTYAGSPAPKDADVIIERINQSDADVLFVAYGAPRQDLWIAQYRDRLQVHVALGVGGAFDYVAGVVPRAPGWMCRIGLEWLYRLLRQPSRWRRMLRLPVFLWLVWRNRTRPLHTAATVQETST